MFWSTGSRQGVVFCQADTDRYVIKANRVPEMRE